MQIMLNNNKCKIIGKVKQVMKVRNHPAFAIRSKGAWYSPAFRKGRWDGYIRFITDGGMMDTGKLPQFLDVMRGLFPDEKIKIIDQRDRIKPKKVPKELNGFKFRDYQREALQTIADHAALGKPFPRGIIGAATNAGKTIMSAGIHAMYQSKTLFLLNSKELFLDAVEEIPKFLPGQVGILASGYETEWNDFMIVMVQTANKRIKEIQEHLSEYPVVIVDECDLGTSATYRNVLAHTYNSYVRIGLSGSAMIDPRHKEKNERLRSIFGNIIYTIRNVELIAQGFSSHVECYIHEGNTTVKSNNFAIEYDEGIIKNTHRNKVICNLVRKEVRKDRLPILVITKNHKHVRRLYKRLCRMADVFGGTLFGLKIDWVHHERKDRREVVKRFTNNQLDILVGSYILKRGKNFPWMQSVIHAGGGDSMATIIQILGRATRKHESKEKTMLHDFFDQGNYLKRHSKHRIVALKREELPVHENYL
jgi:superfamily II DNA or RNA helicase